MDTGPLFSELVCHSRKSGVKKEIRISIERCSFYISAKSIVAGRLRKPLVFKAVQARPAANHNPPAIFAGSGRLHQIQTQNRKPNPAHADATSGFGFALMAARFTPMKARNAPKLISSADRS